MDLLKPALFLLAISLTGCGQAPTKAKFTNHLKGVSYDMLEGVVGRLEDAAGEPFLHAAGDDADIEISLSFDPSLKEPVLGVTYCPDEECTIDFLTDLDPEKYPDPIQRETIVRAFHYVMIHELGHAFGLGHSKREDDIMYPYLELDKIDNDASFSRFMKDLRHARNGIFK